MEIRLARSEDYAEAGEVTAGAYVEFAKPSEDDWDEYLAELADVAGRAERAEVYVAVEDGRVLGCVTLELEEHSGDSDQDLPSEASNIRMLGVRPEARGRGIGRKLVQVCIERSREAGKQFVALHTTPLMRVAQTMYRDMGFERDADRDVEFESGFVLLGFKLSI